MWFLFQFEYFVGVPWGVLVRDFLRQRASKMGQINGEKKTTNPSGLLSRGLSKKTNLVRETSSHIQSEKSKLSTLHPAEVLFASQI